MRCGVDSDAPPCEDDDDCKNSEGERGRELDLDLAGDFEEDAGTLEDLHKKGDPEISNGGNVTDNQEDEYRALNTHAALHNARASHILTFWYNCCNTCSVDITNQST